MTNKERIAVLREISSIARRLRFCNVSSREALATARADAESAAMLVEDYGTQ